MRWLRHLAVGLAWTCAVGAVSAQDYPSRTVTFVANYPPGGAVDITARIVGEKLSKIFGQSIVVENRPGGTGAIGAASVSRAEPDGYTVLVTANPVITMLPVIGKPTFDPIKDLTPVAKVAAAPTILLVQDGSPLRSVSDLVAAARPPEGKALVGVTGVNSGPDIELKILGRLTGSSVTTVPYSGVAPVINDVLGGHIAAGAAGLPAVLPQIQGGKLRGLAVISPARAPLLREVPTVREALGIDLDGFPTWYGFFLPRRTPPGVVERLEAAIRQAMQDPAVQEKMSQMGYEIAVTGSRAFGEENLAEIDRLRRALSGS